MNRSELEWARVDDGAVLAAMGSDWGAVAAAVLDSSSPKTMNVMAVEVAADDGMTRMNCFDEHFDEEVGCTDACCCHRRW